MHWRSILVVALLAAPLGSAETRGEDARLTATQATAGPNLVRNSSFGTRSGPRRFYPDEPWGYGHLDGVARSPFANWGYSGFWDGGDYDIKLGQGRSEQLCARLVCRKRGRGGICTDEIRVTPGATLQFRGWFKGQVAPGACWVNFEGDPGDGWARIDLPEGDGYEWTEVIRKVTVKPPSGQRKVAEDGTVGIYVFLYTTAYGELWIDDISLTLVPD